MRRPIWLARFDTKTSQCNRASACCNVEGNESVHSVKITSTTAPQEVLTVAEAAALFRRSTTWVRNRIAAGQLYTLEPAGFRPILITGASAQQLLKTAKADIRSGATVLRLVVDNTK